MYIRQALNWSVDRMNELVKLYDALLGQAEIRQW